MRVSRLVLLGASLISMSTVLQAQDVVMRRPLPDRIGSTSTPTTSPTPTPSTSTPTPSPSTPTPVASQGYGWAVDCTSNTAQCFEIDYTGEDTDPSSLDYSQISGNPEDSSLCPASQSAGAESLVTAYGLLGVNAAGPQHGLQLCQGQVDAGRQILYQAEAFCDTSSSPNGQTGTVLAFCTGDVVAKPYVAGSNAVVGSFEATPSSCASEQESPDLDALVADQSANGPSIPPSQYASVFAKAGQTCQYVFNRNVYGTTCGSDQSSSCKEITYTDDGVSSPVITSTTSAPYSACQNDQTLNDTDRTVLSQSGLVPGGANSSSTCASPDVYAARGACVQKVTYDTGWPQNGSAHVDDHFHAQCYAVFNSATPSNMTLVSVPVSDCAGQTPNAQQQAILQSLAPDLQDYNTLPQKDGDACQVDAQVQLYYSRSDQPTLVSDEIGETQYDPSQAGLGQIHHDVTVTFTVPYICSELDNFYTDDLSNGMGSEFSMGDEPCQSEHAADLNGLQSTPFGSYETTQGQQDGSPYQITTFPSSDALGKMVGNLSGNGVCNGMGADGYYASGWVDYKSITINDHADQSFMTVTLKGVCTSLT